MKENLEGKQMYSAPIMERKVIEMEAAYATSKSVETTGTSGGSVTETWTDQDIDGGTTTL